MGLRREPMSAFFAALSGLVAALLLGLIALYQRVLSPLLGPKCRFHPTCSSYAAEAIVQYGPLFGTVRALGRIVRCHPLSDGGYDPVPVRRP